MARVWYNPPGLPFQTEAVALGGASGKPTMIVGSLWTEARKERGWTKHAIGQLISAHCGKRCRL